MLHRSSKNIGEDQVIQQWPHMHNKAPWISDCLSRCLCPRDCLFLVSVPVWRLTEQHQRVSSFDILLTSNKDIYKKTHHIVLYWNFLFFNALFWQEKQIYSISSTSSLVLGLPWKECLSSPPLLCSSKDLWNI